MKTFFYLFAVLFLSHLSFANYLDRDDVQDFIDFMHIEHGFSKEYVSKTLSQASKQQNIIDLMNNPSEKVTSWDDYKKRVSITRIQNGLNLNPTEYVDSNESAKKMKFDLNAIFKNFDAIITPAAPGEAPRDLSTTGNAMFNGYWTMMGVPAISLPLLKGKNSLPIGVQVITSWNNDNLLLKISDAILKNYQ